MCEPIASGKVAAGTVTVHTCCSTYLQAEEACAEMLHMLSDFLPKEYPDYFKKQGNTLIALKTDESFQIKGSSMHPLEACARVVQACLRQHSRLRQHQCI